MVVAVDPVAMVVAVDPVAMVVAVDPEALVVAAVNPVALVVVDLVGLEASAAQVATEVKASLRDHTAHMGLSLTRDPLLTTVSMAQKPTSVSMDPRLLLVSMALASRPLPAEVSSEFMAQNSA